MSGVTFLASTGIAAIMLQRVRLDALGHTITITRASDAVRGALAMVGLEDWLRA